MTIQGFNSSKVNTFYNVSGGENNSGAGPNSVVAEHIKKHFNWGAFFFSWIWGLCHKSYITLITIPVAFIPFIGWLINIGLQTWFGIKGNEWAWQNKRWENSEAFHKNQRIWAIVGTVLSIISTIITAVAYSIILTAQLSNF